MAPNKKDKDRVLFAVDASSLLYAARDWFGDCPRIDFIKLLNLAKSFSLNGSSLFIPVIYLFHDSSKAGSKDGLVKYLHRFGFTVVLTPFSATGHQSEHMASVISADIRKRITALKFTKIILATNQLKLSPYISEMTNSSLDVHLLLFGGSQSDKSPPPVETHYLTSEVIFLEG